MSNSDRDRPLVWLPTRYGPTARAHFGRAQGRWSGSDSAGSDLGEDTQITDEEHVAVTDDAGTHSGSEPRPTDQAAAVATIGRRLISGQR